MGYQGEVAFEIAMGKVGIQCRDSQSTINGGHWAVSSNPAMVHLGRQLQVPAAGGRLEASKDDIREGGGPSGYVEDMIHSIPKMNSWVQESQKRYNKEMEEARERKGFKKHCHTEWVIWSG